MSVTVTQQQTALLQDGGHDGVILVNDNTNFVVDALVTISATGQFDRMGKIGSKTGKNKVVVMQPTSSGASAGKVMDLSGYRVSDGATVTMGAQTVSTQTGTFATVLGTAADGATAIGVKVGNTTALANAAAKVVQWYRDNLTTAVCNIRRDGSISPLVGVLGQATDGAGAIGVKIGNVNALANAAARVVQFYRDDFANEVAYLRRDGSFAPLVGLLAQTADGAGAIGIKIGCSNPLTAADGKIVAFYSNDMTTERAAVFADGRLSMLTGAAGVAGTATLVAGTVTVATTAVKAGTLIFLSRNTVGGVLGNLSAPVASIVANTSFVINSDNAGDTSTVNWWIIN